jgi:hypothetical protein
VKTVFQLRWLTGRTAVLTTALFAAVAVATYATRKKGENQAIETHAQ